MKIIKSSFFLIIIRRIKINIMGMACNKSIKNMTRIISIITIMASCIFSTQIFAKSSFNGVGFQVVQHSPTLSDISDVSYVVEDEILNGFFEKGLIASNSPVALFNSSNEKKIYNDGLRDAKDSNFNAFLQINLYYKDGVTNSKLVKLALLEKIEWVLIATPAKTQIARGKKTVTPPSPKDSEEVLRTLMRDIFFDIYQKLKR